MKKARFSNQQLCRLIAGCLDDEAMNGPFVPAKLAELERYLYELELRTDAVRDAAAREDD